MTERVGGKKEGTPEQSRKYDGGENRKGPGTLLIGDE